MTGEMGDVDLERLEELNEKDEDELSDREVTAKIKLSVKRRYDYPTWLMVFEFQNRDQKRADCLALNTSASRNFKLVGFEFKASRSDWLREKKDHQKSDWFVQMSDEWYVVAGRRNVVNEEELPPGWGLLELKPSARLYKLVESDLDPQTQDVEPDRRFYAKFMKKALGDETNFTKRDIIEARRRGYDEAQNEDVAGDQSWEYKQMKKKAEMYDKLSQSPLNLTTVYPEKEFEQLARAKQFLAALDEDNYASIASDMEYLEERVIEKTESVLRDVEQMHEALQQMKDTTIDTMEYGEGMEP